MKKLFLYVFLGLLLSSNVQAKEVLFKCINKDGKERDFKLVIDLQKEKMIRAGVSYEIIYTDNETIVAAMNTNQYFNNLTFNRYSGDLNFKAYSVKEENGKITLKDEANYKCIKMEKLL